jgi:hypothetical protein
MSLVYSYNPSTVPTFSWYYPPICDPRKQSFYCHVPVSLRYSPFICASSICIYVHPWYCTLVRGRNPLICVPEYKPSTVPVSPDRILKIQSCYICTYYCSCVPLLGTLRYKVATYVYVRPIYFSATAPTCIPRTRQASRDRGLVNTYGQFSGTQLKHRLVLKLFFSTLKHLFES